MANRSVVVLKDYGQIQLNLKSLMEERGMSRNELARDIGTRFEVIDKWVRNEVEKMDLDILARLCYVLDCTPGDMLIYTDK